MRPKSVVLAVFLCAVSSIASAASITRLSPSVIPFGNVEEFLTLHGSDLVNPESVVITVAGPAGTFVLEPSAVFGDQVIFFVPEVMLLQEGTNTVTVVWKSFEQAPQTFGPFTFSVETVVMAGPPIISVPEHVLVEAESARGANAFFDVSAMSQTGDVVDIDCSRNSGAFFPLGSTPVVCTATDVNGSSSGEFEVLVADLTAPVLTLPDDFESDTPVVTFEVSAVDNIDTDVTITCNRQSGSTFPAGVIEVVCEAYDDFLNHAFGSFKVTVHGGAPVLTLPGELFVEATSPGGAVVNYTVTATENGVITCTPPSGSTFPLGPTTVSCTATNNVGSTSGSFVVEVIDGSGPVLTLPEDIVAEATSAAGAVVTFTATATDSIDGTVPVTCTPESGSTFPLGVTEVTCSATDLQDHVTTDTFTVTLRDTTAPQVVTVEASPDALWPPNHKMVAVAITVVAVDAVDDSPISRIIAVKSNQPINGTGDGDVAPDWDITGPLTLNLRAERAGSADRIYTITVDTRDESGNSVETELVVKVSQAPRRRAVR